MMEQLSDAELVRRLKAVAEHDNKTKAAKALGINRDSLNHSLRVAEQRGITASTVISDPVAKLKAEVADHKRTIASLQREADTADAIRREIYGLASHTVPELPKWLFTPGKNGTRGTPVSIWSDWHASEVVNKKQMNGLNEFNSEICAQRVKRLTNTLIDLSFNHMGRAKTVYPGIVIMLGGDMISGDIHQELAETNDRTPWQVVNDLTDLLASALSNIADKFGNVLVPCVVGNHGRGTMKPRMKNRVFTSFEWNIYQNLARHFKNDKRFTFLIPEAADCPFNVYDTRFLLTHGDSLGVKGGDGIIGSIGPIMRGALKVGRSEAQVGRDFDYLVMGHWHQMLWLPGCIVNNSLKGLDEYALLQLRAPYSRPSQALWFVHPEHGITARWEIFLEGKREAKADAPWCSFPAENVA